MDPIIQIINAIYSAKGYVITKEITIPFLNKKINATISITAKSPTKFNFTPTSAGGSLMLEPGVQVHLTQLGITSTITQVDINGDILTAHLSGYGSVHYDISKV